MKTLSPCPHCGLDEPHDHEEMHSALKKTMELRRDLLGFLRDLPIEKHEKLVITMSKPGSPKSNSITYKIETVSESK
jgi:hypothetical protein